MMESKVQGQGGREGATHSSCKTSGVGATGQQEEAIPSVTRAKTRPNHAGEATFTLSVSIGE
jgi:hypothetical protein